MSESKLILNPTQNTVSAASSVATPEIQTNELEEIKSENPYIQFKLSVGAADDPLEKEADDMADRIMRMPDNSFIQRKCAHCEEEEEHVQRKSLLPFIQKMGGDAGTKASESVSSKIQATIGGGSPMSEDTKSFMENRFGVDFSDVRVHTDGDAAQMSRELNAQAFTVGNDIYFNSNTYNPSSNSGKHLLAHELTHTIHQRGARQLIQPRRRTTSVRRPKLSFYQNDAHAVRFFRSLATEKAGEIGAIALPVPSTDCPEFVTNDAVPFNTGAEIVNTIADTYRCTGHKVQEVHVFSHGYEGGGGVAATEENEVRGLVNFELTDAQRGQGAASYSAIATEALAENVVFVFHGCQIGVGSDSFAESLFRHIMGTSPRGRVYAHRASGVCGRTGDWREFSTGHEDGRVVGRNPYHRERTTASDTVRRKLADNTIQLKCALCEEETAYQTPLPRSIQKKGNVGVVQASDSVTDQINSSSGNGQRIDGNTQSFMESRFGNDFSYVNIHTGSEAAQLSKELNAKAFTVGNDIYFNEGQYNPSSSEGRHLLAHELTHTLQQGESIGRKIQRVWDPVGTNCASVPAGMWLRSVVVNQEIPQSVTLNWSDGTNESAICSTGKGQCCADTPGKTTCDVARSNVTDTNCTPITRSSIPVISERKTSHNGWQFWNTFVPSRGIALHQHHTVTGEPLSHGCVRMELETARKIFCGARQNVTQVRVEGFARPYCNSPNLQAEWLSDINTAQTPTDGEPADVVSGIRETRKTLRSAFGVNDRALTTLIAGINSGNINSQIPTCNSSGATTAVPTGSTSEEQKVFSEAQNVSHFMVVFAREMIALNAALRNSADLISAQAAVNSSGTALWQAALRRAQTAATAQTDDRSLYWARLRMIEAIRGFSPSFTITSAERQALVDSFEQNSRGINAIPFVGISSSQKRILISGFDPFTGDGNPSGAIVQALSGQTISFGSCTAMVHGVVFPVRYADFDQGMIERFFGGFLSGTNRADMIMTISLNPNLSFPSGSGGTGSPAHGNLFLDHWAARQRGGFPDNNGIRSTDADLESNLSARYPGTSRRDEFIGSTLPFTTMTANSAAAIEHSFSGIDSSRASITNPTNGATGNPAGLSAVSGSGGSFLSNEIFYRVRLLQLNQSPASTIPMGHLHVPNTSATDYPALVRRVRQMLQQAVANLCPTT